MAQTARYAQRFAPGVGDRDFFLSYGLAVPEAHDYDLVSFWAAGGYAARLRRIGLADGFTAPGQAWLSTVDPSLTGREIVTGGLELMPEDVPFWGKPAEAKINAMVAGKYTAADVRIICNEYNVPDDTLFQWTESFLSLNFEHRFYVCDGEVVTGSPYLIDGEISFEGPFAYRHYDEAFEAAQTAVKELGDNQCRAYTLDMGLDTEKGKWIIIEANPAWSSGIYGCDPTKVIDVLDIACNTFDPQWRWEPARYLVEQAEKHSLLNVVDPENGHGIWKHYSV